MNDAIYISIKPQYTKLIEKKEKNYEFRNYLPKKEFKYLYVYETTPTGKLKYIMEIDNIVKYPDKIDENGIGNIDFNKGLQTKYAYHIKHVYLLDEIPLDILKNKYKFMPPQAYAYDNKYKKLTEYILNSKKTKLF